LALRDTFKNWTPGWALPLARAVYHSGYRASLRARFALADARSSGDALPPARLRFRVSETLDPQLFRAVGENAARHVKDALTSVGRPIEDFKNVLEFGCGCGRVIAPLAREFPQARFFGTDVDAEAISWCATNLSGIEFKSNGELPPLPYDAQQFDLVYCISVFTHLDDAHTRAWLAELNRVVKPEGIVALSTHGEHVWQSLPKDQQHALIRDGYLFQRTQKLRGIQPEWYQTSYHAREYILGLVAHEFNVLAHIPQGMGYQDLIVAEKPR
jgi:ubiquinone/menaquinone biosynthesis C-methylase UbiE